MNGCQLWKHDSFINTNIPFLFNKEIIEYDMKEAGFSLTKEYNLLDEETIKKLDKYKKERRKIELGNMQRNNETYKKQLKEAFAYARELFFIANDLDNMDIISIKKDAIFCSKRCNIQTVGKFITFRPKNVYSSYIQLEKNLEFYYRPDALDVKGMNNENIELHKEYMISFIQRFFYKMETEDEETVIGFVKRFIDKYKRMELEVGYYRSFDHESNFKLMNDNSEVFMEFWEDDKELLDIRHNFQKILLKFAQIPL